MSLPYLVQYCQLSTAGKGARPFSSLAEQARVLLRKLRRVEFGAAKNGRFTGHVGITPGNQYLAARKQCGGVAEARLIHAAGYGPCVAGESIEEAYITGRAATAPIVTPRSAGQHVSVVEKRSNGRWPRSLRKSAGAGP